MKNKAPTVLIAGSRALPTGIAPRLLVRFLATLPDRSRILLRRGLFSSPGLFEAQVETICDILGLKVQWCQPQPVVRSEPGPGGRIYDSERWGREATFARDLQMIEWADLVLCFYTSDQIGDESSGTAALVEKALQAEKTVYAYAIDGESISRVGENDPGNRWAALVPATA